MRRADRGTLAGMALAAAAGALAAMAWRRAPRRQAPAAPAQPELAPPADAETKRGSGLLVTLASAAVVLVAGASGWMLLQREDAARTVAAQLTRGAPERGRTVLARWGCGGCHEIPGVPGAHGQVGPPLGTVAARGYIAGRAPNGPETLVRFILDPPSIDPDTAMPVTGISEAEARDAAAYLYSLR